jgi:hypothetical protein
MLAHAGHPRQPELRQSSNSHFGFHPRRGTEHRDRGPMYLQPFLATSKSIYFAKQMGDQKPRAPFVWGNKCRVS